MWAAGRRVGDGSSATLRPLCSRSARMAPGSCAPGPDLSIRSNVRAQKMQSSITALASVSSSGGGVRPSTVAVLRLILNMNFVGFSDDSTPLSIPTVRHQDTWAARLKPAFYKRVRKLSTRRPSLIVNAPHGEVVDENQSDVGTLMLWPPEKAIGMQWRQWQAAQR